MWSYLSEVVENKQLVLKSLGPGTGTQWVPTPLILSRSCPKKVASFLIGGPSDRAVL